MRRALVSFARWLREEYDFPQRVPVYLSPKATIRTVEGADVTASFFAPFDRGVEPYIRIATGDYAELLRGSERNDVLASYIVSLAHEVVHYHQWLETGTTTERGVVRRAVAMLRRYERTVEAP